MWTLVSNVGLVIEKGGKFKLVKRGDSKYLVKENFDVERLIGDHQVRDPRTKYPYGCVHANPFEPNGPWISTSSDKIEYLVL